MNEELFPNSRQRPLGQSAGGHNNLLPQLQQENNDNADNSEFATDEGHTTDNADTDEKSAEDVTDGDGTGDSSDNDADDEVNDASSDSDNTVDPGPRRRRSSRWWSWPHQTHHTHICRQQYLRYKFPHTRIH